MKFKVGDRVSRTAYPCSGTVLGYLGRSPVVQTDNRDFVAEFKFNGRIVYGLLLNDSNWRLIKSNNKIVITTDGVTTLARLYDGEKIVKSAEAKCSPSDAFNFNTGAQLAYNRLMYGTDYRPSEVAFKPEQPKHQYKVGDKVKIAANNSCHSLDIGDIAELYERGHFANHWRARRVSDGQPMTVNWVCHDDIEPYTEQPKPKYYNGKVVCVKTDNEGLTARKIYDITDGVLCWDSGNKCSRLFTSLEDLNHWDWFYPGTKFIEYKGEA